MPDDLQYLDIEFYRRLNNVSSDEELEMEDRGIELKMYVDDGVLFLKFKSQEDLNLYRMLDRVKDDYHNVRLVVG